MTCHVLPYEQGDGPANMALDEALLDFVAAGNEAAFLRTYGWTIPTLSLGYFQHLADARAEPRWREVPIVRRLSGGGAIWHHHEVTYAVVVPASSPLARPSTGLYRAVHTAIADTLESLGVRASLRGDAVDSRNCERRRPLLCFTDTNPEDIVTYGVKIAGSAQRRRGGAVLQHGSVLLARSCRTPELLGICDVAELPAEPLDWSERLLERIPDALGLHPLAVRAPDEVRVRATELERIRYRDPAWTELR
ncbi:MAG: biotin/lipoate A/B protein ligase family protein [Isosphaerales bacterium]